MKSPASDGYGAASSSPFDRKVGNSNLGRKSALALIEEWGKAILWLMRWTRIFLVGLICAMLALLIAVCIFGAVKAALKTYTPEEKARMEAEETVQRHDRVCESDPYTVAGWQVETRSAVEAKLKAPSTAKFETGPFGTLEARRVRRDADCVFTVTGQVDAQNSFGAMLSSYYKVSLIYDAKSNRWTVMSVNVE